MSIFNYKEIYVEEGKRVLEMNILPEKYCNFDCIFCPIGRTKNKLDASQAFADMESSLKELDGILEKDNVELVFINSKGEAFVNDRLVDVINLVKGRGLSIRLLSNGYVLGKPEYLKLANMCEEVIGELKVVSEEHFQKLQRPIDGYTMEEHIANMVSFNQQYNGKFIFEITIIKGYNDDEESIQKLKNVIRKISPYKTIVVRIDDEIFKDKLCISDERFKEISDELLNI